MLLQGQHGLAVKGPFVGGRACAGVMAGWHGGAAWGGSVAAALLPFTGQGREARESLSGSVTPTVVEKAPSLHDPVAGGTCGPASSQR